jgi:hypothetical protein
VVGKVWLVGLKIEELGLNIWEMKLKIERKFSVGILVSCWMDEFLMLLFLLFAGNTTPAG